LCDFPRYVAVGLLLNLINSMYFTPQANAPCSHGSINVFSSKVAHRHIDWLQHTVQRHYQLFSRLTRSLFSLLIVVSFIGYWLIKHGMSERRPQTKSSSSSSIRDS